MAKSTAVLFSFLLLLAAACGGDGAPPAPDLEVSAGWARAMPGLTDVAGGRSNSAVYLVIRNRGGASDRLVGGESSVSDRVEVHETRMVDDVMRMRELDGLEIPSRGFVEMAPGGIHMMLLGLTQTLQDGDSMDLTLLFEKTGRMELTLPVRLLGEG